MPTDFDELPDTAMPVCGTLTVTLQVAVLPPALAVIVAVPPPTAVILPLLLTVATFVFELVYVTVLLVASLGVTVAEIVDVSPFFRVRLVLLSETPVTGFDIVIVPPLVAQA